MLNCFNSSRMGLELVSYMKMVKMYHPKVTRLYGTVLVIGRPYGPPGLVHSFGCGGKRHEARERGWCGGSSVDGV